MTRWHRLGFGALGVIAVAVIALLFAQLTTRVTDAEGTGRAAIVAADTNAATALEAKEAAERLAAQLRAGGEVPVVEPSSIGDPVTSAPVPTSPGGRGPSTAQVAAAVARYCSTVGCNGTRGAPGTPGARGARPSPTEVAAAVVAYCRANTCRGAPGPSGADGSPGADGANGTDGPPGADGANGERGETGPQGPPGADGAPGGPGAQGPPGTAVAGAYVCSDGQYVAGLTVAEDGSVSLDCRELVGP